jgi:PAP2 superfamily
MTTTTHRPIGNVRPALLGELAVVFVLVVAYDRIRDVAQARPAVSAIDGARVLDAERVLHLDMERWLNLWVSSHENLAVVASWYYQLLHLSVSMAVLLACYVCRPDIYRAARNALVSINLIALMIFWVFPVAPPRLLAGGGYIDTAVATGVGGLVDSASANPYAAMPSLHLAWAVWSVMFAAAIIRRRSLRLLLYAYPVVTTVVVMATANHYLLDALAGAALALTAGWICLRRQAAASPGRKQHDDAGVTLTDGLHDPATLRVRETAGQRQP